MSATERPDAARASPPLYLALVYVLFFLSGLAALVYEASWSRMVGLTLGHVAQAAALVLAAYFTGLAIGQLLGGLLAGRVPPLLGYGVAELVAAAWACLVPTLLDRVGSVAGDSSVGRAAWCFLALVPATVPLGATLPLVVQALATPRVGRQHRAPLAYALNTAGGLVGMVAASAFLLVIVGVRAGGLAAAALSAACGLVACVASHRRWADTPPETADVPPSPADSWAWLTTATISGFGILGLEVLHTRLFSLIFHNSIYTFGAVVAAFLLALSLGAALASWLGRRLPTQLIATASFSLGAIALALSVAAFPRLTGLDPFSFGDSFAAYLAGAFGLVAFFVLPPVTLLAMALPAGLQAASQSGQVGRLTAVNTLAGVAGAIAAGFLLPPLLGLWPAFAAFVALFGVAGAVMLLALGRNRNACVAGLATAGMVVLLVWGSPSQRQADGALVIRRWESAYGWIDVVRSPQDGSFAVRQNLHYRYGSTAKPYRQQRLGRLPALLHPRPSEVAFLGLGTGLTAAPATADPSVEAVVVVELIPEVVQAARSLGSANLGVVDHPRVEVRVADARHYLHQTDRHFDVIVSDLFVPWESRAGYLYTAEFYQSARRRLKPGGLFCQWLALYQLGPEQFELIADTFSSAFPQVSLWWGQLDGNHPIVGLVGSEEPLAIEHAQLEGRLDVVPGAGADPDLRMPSDVPALYLGGWVRDPSRKLNSDEHPWLEFTAPLSHRDGRTLHGRVLRRYFDEVLARLPAGDVRFRGFGLLADDERRRAIQRLSLFGAVEP